jgi:hypothetical protein
MGASGAHDRDFHDWDCYTEWVTRTVMVSGEQALAVVHGHAVQHRLPAVDLSRGGSDSGAGGIDQGPTATTFDAARSATEPFGWFATERFGAGAAAEPLPNAAHRPVRQHRPG